MDALLMMLAPRWDRQPGAPPDAIRAAERQLGGPLPAEYVALLAWSNGGDGWIGEHYCVLWPVEGLATINADYELTDAPGPIVGIGGDGGGECFALDYRNAPDAIPLVLLPLIGFDDPETWLPFGASFQKGVWQLLADPHVPFNR